MRKKTWKLGEVCKGGIITVETKSLGIISGAKATQVAIIGKEWDHSAGDRRSSNQSNAKEWTRKEFIIHGTEGNFRIFYTMEEFLTDLTRIGYAEQILEWIKTTTGHTN